MTEGHIRGIELVTLLQAFGADRRTCSLEVEKQDTSGTLWLADGDLIDAETGPLTGLEAAYEIVTWQDTEVRIAPENGHLRVIEAPLVGILIDARQRLDERQEVRDAEAATLVTRSKIEERSTEVRLNTLQQQLDKFSAEVPEFVSSDLVNIESGLSIGGNTCDAEFDTSIASASYAEVVKASRQAFDLLGLGSGSAEDILVTSENLYILVRMLGSEYCQIVAISRRGNLGLARVLMKKYEPLLLDAINRLS